MAELRHRRGLSQEQLGFESGYHRTYISLLERGLKSPSLRTIYDLSNALHQRPSEVMLLIEALTANEVASRSKRRPKKK